MTPPFQVLWLALAYSIGAFPTGYLMGKWLKGIDIREHGSGNPGATNVFRTVGKGAGIATLLIDFLKGYLPVLITMHFSPQSAVFASLIGLATISGHNWSFWLRFNGGKGVATSAGVFMALLPLPTVISIIVFALAFWISKHVSIGSMAGAMSQPLAAWILKSNGYLNFLSLACAMLIVVMHRKNIVRLMRDEEHKISGDKNKNP